MASSALIYGGLLLSGLLGLLSCQSAVDTLTIGIESGIVVSGHMIITTMPEPYCSIADIIPLANFMSICLPYLIYIVLYKLYRHFQKPEKIESTKGLEEVTNHESIKLMSNLTNN